LARSPLLFNFAPNEPNLKERMKEEQRDFIAALAAYVAAALAAADEPAEYCREAVRVVDARNRLFCPAGRRATDESEDVYALRDLCRLDEDTLELVPDEGRIACISRNYF